MTLTLNIGNSLLTLNYQRSSNLKIICSQITAAALSELIGLLQENRINVNLARLILQEMLTHPQQSPSKVTVAFRSSRQHISIEWILFRLLINTTGTKSRTLDESVNCAQQLLRKIQKLWNSTKRAKRKSFTG